MFHENKACILPLRSSLMCRKKCEFHTQRDEYIKGAHDECCPLSKWVRRCLCECTAVPLHSDRWREELQVPGPLKAPGTLRQQKDKQHRRPGTLYGCLWKRTNPFMCMAKLSSLWDAVPPSLCNRERVPCGYQHYTPRRRRFCPPTCLSCVRSILTARFPICKWYR